MTETGNIPCLLSPYILMRYSISLDVKKSKGWQNFGKDNSQRVSPLISRYLKYSTIRKKIKKIF